MWYDRILLVFTIFISFSGYSQPLINETDGRNPGIVMDEDNEFPTWIELYNPGQNPIDLWYYFLSDKKKDPYRWHFPHYILGSGKKLLVFCSGKNRSKIPDHWEFPVWYNDVWRYHVGLTTPGNGWSSPTFSDITWSTGRGGFGFGDGDDSTLTSTSAVSVFLRKRFDIPDTSKIVRMLFSIDYDDGFIAYLNGVEIARNNMGNASYTDVATGSREATMYSGGDPEIYEIPDTQFQRIIKPTGNILAIQVHNSSAGSSDLSAIPFLSFSISDTTKWYSKRNVNWLGNKLFYFHTNFKLRRDENIYLYRYDKELTDSQNSGFLDSGFVRARIPDGQGWCITDSSTPGKSNDSIQCIPGFSPAPQFSVKAGYIKGPQSLYIISPTRGFQVRYTINGNTPDSTSKIYTGPITLTKSVVIRARCYDSNNIYLPSKIVTNTYLVNETSSLPVLSISTDSSNLWDYYTGIYVYGPTADSINFPFFGSNFWKDWEKPAHIEYFKPSKGGQQLFELDAALSIHGNYSKGYPQRSFRIETRDIYDSSEINYPIFGNRFYNNPMNFNVRNAGIDWMNCHMRDDGMHRGVKNTHIDIMETQACLVFLNGKYWGLYHIREKQDEDYLTAIHGVDKDNLDILKWNNTVLHGNVNDWNQFFSFVYYNTMTNQANYDSVKKMMDMENYFDYFITETYYVNNDWLGSWTNNIKFWKERKPGKKWRYCLWDLDFGLGLSSSPSQDKLYGIRFPASWNWHSVIFDSLMVAPEFRNLFVNRYADLINTIFLPSKLRKSVNEVVDTMRNEMLRQVKRWSAATDLNTWNNYLNGMYSFIDNRPSYARNYIQSNFNLTGQVTLQLNVNPGYGGKIHISTIIPEKLPWSGVYFDGSPVPLYAIPSPGFEFSHYIINGNNDSNQNIRKNFTANTSITAVFKGSSQLLRIAVSEINYNSNPAYPAGDWIELHNYSNYNLNITNWLLRTSGDYKKIRFKTGTVIKPGGYLIICSDTNAFKKVYPSVPFYHDQMNFELDDESDSIKIYNASGNLIINLQYNSTGSWPRLAAGTGATLEHLNDSADYNFAESWLNGCPGGSPGKSYFPCSYPVIVSEINYKSSSKADMGDWIELYNTTNSDINISGWHISDEIDSHQFVLPKNIIIESGERIVICTDTVKFDSEVSGNIYRIGNIPFGFSSGGDWIRIYDSLMNPTFMMWYSSGIHWPYKADGKGYTLESKFISGDFSSPQSWKSGCLMGSPGDSMKPCSYPAFISEINFNMDTSLYTHDFIELYNTGKKDIYCGGWKIQTSSDTFIVSDSIVMDGKSSFVIAAKGHQWNKKNMAELNNFTLNDTGDAISILDEHNYPVSMMWFNLNDPVGILASGNGYTLENKTDTAFTFFPYDWFNGCLGGSPKMPYNPCSYNLNLTEFNPYKADSTHEDTWLELQNRTGNSLNLSGYKSLWNNTLSVWSKNNTYILNPGSYITVTSDTAYFDNFHPNTPRIYIKGLNFNQHNTYKLYDTSGKLMLSTLFPDVSKIKGESFHTGYPFIWNTSGLKMTDLANENNWKPACWGGSPSMPSTACNDSIYFTEWMQYPDTITSSGRWIELYNGGKRNINLNKYIFLSNKNMDTINQNMILLPSEYILLCDSGSPLTQKQNGKIYELQQLLNNVNSIKLKDLDGNLLDSTTFINNTRLETGAGASQLIHNHITHKIGRPGGNPWQPDSLYMPPISFTEFYPRGQTTFQAPPYIEWQNNGNDLNINNYLIVWGNIADSFRIHFNYNFKHNEKLILTQDTAKFKEWFPEIHNYLYVPFNFRKKGILRMYNSINQPMIYILIDSIGHEINKTITDYSEYSSIQNYFDGCFGGSPLQSFIPCNKLITISEIQYNPGNILNSGDWFEYIKDSIYSGNITNLSFYSEGKKLGMTDSVLSGIRYIFSGDSLLFRNIYGKGLKVKGGAFNLDSTSILIWYDANGIPIGYQEYGFKNPWPDSTFGTGKTIELKDYLHPHDPSSWINGCVGGSPGQNYSPCFSTGVNSMAESGEFLIYPNPFSEYLYIQSNRIIKSINIYDMSGRCVWQSSFQGTLYNLPLSTGLYQMDLIENNGEIKHIKLYKL